MLSCPRCGDVYRAYRRLGSRPSDVEPMPRVNAKLRLGPTVPVPSSSGAQPFVDVGNVLPLDISGPQMVDEVRCLRPPVTTLLV